MVAKGTVGKAKAVTGGARGGAGAATKRKSPRSVSKKKPPRLGGKKGSKKKGKGRRKKRKKKGPRCPIKRRKKPLKRKCFSMTDMRALLNTYYTMHGVVEMLKFRKFKWKKKKKRP